MFKIAAAAAATIGTSTLPVMAAATSPDAELIGLCAAFVSANAKMEAASQATTAAWLERHARSMERQLRRIVAVRATTIEGVQARARMQAAWRAVEDGAGLWDTLMTEALLRDLTAGLVA